MRMVLLVLALLLPLAAQAEKMNGFEIGEPLVRFWDIKYGGPPRDGIPSIDQPRFIPADEADWLNERDLVMGVEVAGRARAYPVAILNWHEIVNDELAGRPLVVTFCPLCGTGVVYEAEVAGQRLEFGVSGLLYNSDVLLYDRQTESLWSQLMHQAITGPYKGTVLTRYPSRLLSWGEWRARFPATEVLSRETGHARDYGRDPYGGYAETPELFFEVSAHSRRFHPKERVLGVEWQGQFKAYAFAELARKGARGEIRDRLGSLELRVRYDAERRTGEVLASDGRLLPAINAFWFAWFAFHPDTLIWEAEP